MSDLRMEKPIHLSNALLQGILPHRLSAIVICLALFSHCAAPLAAGERGRRYPSPVGLSIAGDGKLVFVALRAENTVAVVDPAHAAVVRRIPVGGAPGDVLLNGNSLLVGGSSGLQRFDAAGDAGKPTTLCDTARITALAAARDGRIAAVDNWNSTVLLFDAAGKLLHQWTVDPNPQHAAFTPGGQTLLVTCDSPGTVHRTVCLIDVAAGTVRRVVLPGSALLRGVAVSPGGRFALVAHVRPRANLPATQVAQGWVFTNSISYLPLARADTGAAKDGADQATAPRTAIPLPLDEPGNYYATPYDVVFSPGGLRAYVSHAGADVVSVLDTAALQEVAQRLEEEHGGPSGRGEDLRLSRRYVKQRVAVGANPRRLAVSPGGTQLIVANHLGDSLSVIDTQSGTLRATIPLADDGPVDRDEARRGEILFNSAQVSFQRQFSCAACHPDGGTDGLNWDLPADGIGNFHNTKTLVGIAGTQPYGWLGNSTDFPSRFQSTLSTLFQHTPAEGELAVINAYLSGLHALPLPPRIDPESAAAMRGAELFEDAGCARCHAGPQMTDNALHNVGTALDADPTEAFDTPSLLGVSETAPYLHHGRAQTLEEVFTQFNSAGKHGEAGALTAEELGDLVAFLKSRAAGADPGVNTGAGPVQTGGTGVIEGKITFRGEVPKHPIPDNTGIARDLLHVDRKTMGLRYAAVYVDATGGLPTAGQSAENERAAGETPPPTIDQREYTFVPHMIAVRHRQSVTFTNSDGGNHNVRGTALDPRNQFNFFTAPGGAREHRFYAHPKGRPVRVSCDIHPWMTGWIYVFTHPYYAITADDGRFRIAEVPAGTHRVTVVQPDVGILRRTTVTVEAGRDVRLDIEFSPEDIAARR